jgi:hypothetical protein
VLTETIPETMELSTKFLHDSSSDLAAILRLLDESSPRFWRVTETAKIERHGNLLM